VDGLAELRRRRGLSVAELGQVAGVSPQTIKDVEAGRVAPKRRTVERLAEGLRVDPAGVAEFARPGVGAGDRRGGPDGRRRIEGWANPTGGEEALALVPTGRVWGVDAALFRRRPGLRRWPF